MLLPLLLMAAAALAGQDTRGTGEIADLERIMEVKVSSVQRREQRLGRSAAAVYVITQEDIRRSGVTSIVEALRLAPGMHVARVDSRRWAVSARGFTGEAANKLLVLIDGRSVYTPLYSGVFWDTQDTLLEDIDRIGTDAVAPICRRNLAYGIDANAPRA